MVEHEKQTSPLSNREISEADKRSSPSAKVVHEAILLEGIEELDRPTSSIAWSGLAAGLTMGASMLGQGFIGMALPEARWAHLLSAFGYTLGFVFVTMGRQQLFTETTLTVTLPVLDRSRGASGMVRYWSVVFAANVVGTLLFAAAMMVPGLLSPEALREFVKLGVKAADPGFAGVLMKGVIAGWLIALMVWLMPAAASARILVIVAVTWLISAGEFSHVIAGSIETALAAIQGQIGWDAYWLGFLLPALIGNSIGGVVFVALLNHAQVKAEV